MAGGWWLVVVFPGWGETAIASPLEACGRLSKIRGAGLLTGVGGRGGAEDRVGLRAFRHHVGWWLRGLGRRWRSVSCFLRLDGWLLPGLALLLQLLQFVQGGGEGTLQARAVFGDAVEQIELAGERHSGRIDTLLAGGHARQQPLRSAHLFEKETFGGGFGPPLGFEVVPELPVVGDVLAGDEQAAGAQAVGDGVLAGGGDTFGSSRAGAVLRVLPVGLLLFFGNDHAEVLFDFMIDGDGRGNGLPGRGLGRGFVWFVGDAGSGIIFEMRDR